MVKCFMTNLISELLDHHHVDKEAVDFCNLFIKKDNVPKFIYGINEYALSITKALRIDGFIDDFRQEKEFKGIPIVRLEDVPLDALVVTAIVGIIPVSIKKRVRNRGLRHIDYFSFCRYSGLDINKKFLFDFKEFKEDFFKNKDRYEKIYKLLADEESKDVYRRIINFRFHYDLSYMEKFIDRRGEQYFEDFLKITEDEIFVDVGGFEGETTLEFIKRVPSYKSIYFFEPDRENFRVAEKRLSNYRDIYFFNLGLSNYRGFVGFEKGRDASKISEKGQEKIFVDRLDNIIKGPITFIKVDVEGAEEDVLEGASNTIEEYKPKLAIAAYHRFNDFWVIPEKILSISTNYSIYMRHYTEGFTETILYGVSLKI